MRKNSLTVYIIILVILVISFLFGQGRFKFGLTPSNKLEDKALSLSDDKSVVLNRFDYDEMFNQFSVVIIKESTGKINVFNFTKSYFFPLFSLEQQYSDVDLEKIKYFGITTTTRDMTYELILNESADDITFNVQDYPIEKIDYMWIFFNFILLFASVFGILQYFNKKKNQI